MIRFVHTGFEDTPNFLITMFTKGIENNRSPKILAKHSFVTVSSKIEAACQMVAVTKLDTKGNLSNNEATATKTSDKK